MGHLKRYEIPRFWRMKVKEKTFAVAPRGPHPQQLSVPLRTVVRDILGSADTGKEADRIIVAGSISVDKKPRTDRKFGVGLMDIVEVPSAGKAYRIGMKKGGLVFEEVRETDRKLCKILGKRSVRKGKEQLNLHDGKNIFVEKQSPYRVGDSVLLSLPELKILSHFPLARGSEVLVVAGRNKGVRGIVSSLRERKQMTEKATAILEAEGQKIETLRSYLMVLSANGETPKTEKKREVKKAKKSKGEA